jgi:probable DNA repair protein
MPSLPDDSQLNDDGRAFAAWMRAFRERCASDGWIDPAALGSALRARWQGGEAPCPGRIAFIGFDAPTPILRALFAALQVSGWLVEWSAVAPVETRAAVIAFADRREETRAAAAWVRGAFAAGEPPSIGVIVPDLPARRRLIEEVFDDVLDPGSLLHADDPAGRAWSIARGEPLARHPVVAAALAALSVGRRRWPLDVAGILLRTPFLMRSADEVPDLTRLDRLLRRRGESHCDLRTLLRVARSPVSGAPPAIAARLNSIVEVLDSLPSRQTARGWAASFSRILTAAGWPGWRPLDSGEYQAAGAWREALDDFAGLDLFGGMWGFDKALSVLSRLVEEDFQPRTAETPVQVLGMEGAADMGFDCLWVMGLDEGSWPPAARPSPFLPMHMQRDLAMPYATPEIALASGRALTRRLAACAPQVVFSHPRNEGETPLRISPLIASLQGGDVPRIAAAPDYVREVFASRSVESFDDARAADVAPDRAVRGGAGLLRDQAACPFRAFARHRLGARPLDRVDIGLDAMERGLLLHAILDAVWKRLGDHASLIGADEPALERMIDSTVEDAVEEMRRDRPATVTPRFAEVEKTRLRKLARGWLELERSRTPFIVEAREETREITIGGLRLRLRVDRIDRLPDGRRLILDYKTGDTRLSAWFGQRPDDPQLPLYAITDADPVAGLAFARVANGGHAFVGVAESDGLLPGLVAGGNLEKVAGLPDWGGLMKEWYRVIESLVAGFGAGEAAVDPKSPQSCRECDLHAFCRIQELRPWSGEIDD